KRYGGVVVLKGAGTIIAAEHHPLAIIDAGNAGMASGGMGDVLAAGIPDDDSDLEGGVFAASYGYGLDGLTLRTGGVFNQDWQGA
ncbi:hypothetical protein MJN76_34310, partial [Salmonella enterica subsp. enterica serovar Anatum]|nr:hypothetical protein [Salmonella enterica subsp. enterica serovar Anatum]